MSRVVKQPDIIQTLLDIQRRIRILEAAPRLTASNIQTNGNSRLSVTDANGNLVVQMGDFAAGFGTGFLAKAPGGSGLAELAVYQNPGSGNPQIAVFDNAGNPVFALNNAQPGLGHPYMHAALYPLAETTTASTSFVTLYQGQVYLQAAALQCDFYAFADSASTGAARLLVGGVQLGSTVVVPTSTNQSYTIGPLVVPGWSFGQTVYVELQIERTAGTGNVGLTPIRLLNREP